jgi:nitrous oxidase accessory protein
MILNVLILFVIGSYPSFSADSYQHYSSLTSREDVILVDDDGDGDYTSIQEAVNNSNPGDIIEIYSGTYNEYNIIISHPVHIIGIPHELGQGNDTGKPLITPSHFLNFFVLMNIFSPFVSIGECCFQAYNEYDNNGAAILIKNSDYCTIFDCDLKDIGGGIEIWHSYNTIIQNNTMDNIFEFGIWMQPSSYNNTIRNNTISNFGGFGIDFNLDLEAPYNCSLVNNHISEGNVGIKAVGSGIMIFDNVIENCYESGVASSSFKSLIHNRIYNCSKGINIICNNNLIKENLISGCKVGMKIFCQGINASLIQNNEIRNSRIGMIIDEPDVYIMSITQNNFIQNKIQTFFTAINPSRSNSIWSKNYWGETLNLPKSLFGFGILLFSNTDFAIGLPIPWVCYDLHPAQEPYDIPGMS